MSNKRERELARARYQRQQVRRQAKSARNRVLKQLGAGLLAVALLSAIAASRSAAPNASASPQASASTSASCQPPATLRADNLSWPKAPTDTKAAAGITLATNCGDINITIDPKAPLTGGVMTFLAKNKYFDATACHRLTTSGIFVLQCGDPKGNGTGGPGFSFADENLPTDGKGVYPAGTVAMANSGAGTNGSQFFLVYKDSPLPPNYSVWGSISGGMDVLNQIAAAGVADGSGDGSPAQPVVITAATAS